MNTKTAEMLGLRIDRLKKRLSVFERDARRYQWVLKKAHIKDEEWKFRHSFLMKSEYEDLSKAIDLEISMEEDDD